MVEGACLENRCTCERTGGSNPSLTAERNAAGRASDRLFLDSGVSQACLADGRSRKQPVGPKGRQLHSMLCRAPRRAFREVDGRMPDKSLEGEGLLLAGNGFEIIQNLLSQEFNQRQVPVSDKKMSIHFKQRLL